MPYSAALLWPSRLSWENSEAIFFYGLGVHFDIWNKIGEKIFSNFFSKTKKKYCKGPPYDFEKKNFEIFFSPILFQISKCTPKP